MAKTKRTPKSQMTEEQRKKEHIEWLYRKTIDPLDFLLKKVRKDGEYLARANSSKCSELAQALNDSRAARSQVALSDAVKERNAIDSRIASLQKEAAQTAVAQ